MRGLAHSSTSSPSSISQEQIAQRHCQMCHFRDQAQQKNMAGSRISSASLWN
uniref:Uncharacterized protein n=1 Tax=Arundo donax TaxID=35708 RepID=A0A0A9FYF4_ARUDO